MEHIGKLPSTLCDVALNSVWAGAYLVEGFADGISENTYRAEAKARAMARAAAEAAEDGIRDARE